MTGPGRLVAFAGVVGALATLLAWLFAGLGDVHIVARVVGSAAATVAAVALVERIPGARRGAHGPQASGASDDEDAFERVWRAAAQPARAPDPPERETLRRLVRIAMSTAGDAHERLRPALRELADARLEAVHGTHLDQDPRAAERLGPLVWAWVRPDRPQPRDRFEPGPSPAELDGVLDALERLGSVEGA